MNRVVTSVGLAVLALAGCGSDDAGSDAGVSVSNAWARASAPGQTSGAVYFELESGADDTLLGVSVPDSVAGDSQIHESMPGADGGESSEATEMRQVTDGLALTAGEAVVFSPGGYHVMLLDLVDPLEVGERFDMTLDFAGADPVTVSVDVAETAP